MVTSRPKLEKKRGLVSKLNNSSRLLVKCEGLPYGWAFERLFMAG